MTYWDILSAVLLTIGAFLTGPLVTVFAGASLVIILAAFAEGAAQDEERWLSFVFWLLASLALISWGTLIVWIVTNRIMPHAWVSIE